ncbi:hypothetical protein JCM17823_21730 [Halorubrum gandharaense]
MTKWLHSGRRRDICALVHDAGELRAQSLKNRLETHYDQRIDPGSFYGTLSALDDAGFLERHTEGLADVYALFDAGERALRDHYDWLSERMAAGESRQGAGEDRTATDDGAGEDRAEN